MAPLYLSALMEDNVLNYILQNWAREEDEQYTGEHLIPDSLVDSTSKNV